MIISFGISWPLSIVRSVRSRSTKGKSVLFSIFIAIGYVCGHISKCMTQTYNLAFWFYFPNLFFVCTDICLYFATARLNAARGRAEFPFQGGIIE